MEKQKVYFLKPIVFFDKSTYGSTNPYGRGDGLFEVCGPAEFLCENKLMNGVDDILFNNMVIQLKSDVSFESKKTAEDICESINKRNIVYLIDNFLKLKDEVKLIKDFLNKTFKS